ncbi:MAG TPA: MgtC/SapB family protein [Polyangiaceae bacterium]
MDAYEPFLSLGLAIGAGLLIGLEREQSQDRDREHGPFIGGVRTFPLFALLGCLSVLLRPTAVSWLPLAAFCGVVVFVAISYADDVRHQRDRGLTTEGAILVTFLLGVLAPARDVIEPTSRRVLVVAALAVVVTFLLSSKPRLQSLLQRVSKDDLYATSKFLIVLVLVLPLLPNRTVGPLDVINPFQVGLMVVLIASISFTGYVATRVFGARRGLAVTAVFGGLVSSTAVTLSFAGRARRAPELVPIAAAAIVLASTIMFARILVEVGVIYPPLLRSLLLPVLASSGTGVTVALLFYRKARAAPLGDAQVSLKNPFELMTALRFGALFALVLLISKAAEMHLGSAGLYATAALAGLTDVDAITLSTASLARAGLAPTTAATTILVGAASNTVAKAALASVLGGARLGKLVGLAFLAMLASAALCAVLTMGG